MPTVGKTSKKRWRGTSSSSLAHFSGTGDTLCEAKKRVMLEEPVFPETVISMAIEPRSGQDRDRLQEILGRLSGKTRPSVLRSR